MRGLHLTADLYGCTGDRGLLVSAQHLARHCRRLVEQAGLTPVAERFHPFAGAGVTGVVLLAESHLAIHTWPELDAVTLDVYVCNLSRNNSARAQSLLERLVAAFAPTDRTSNRLERGSLAHTPVLEALGEDPVHGLRPRQWIESRPGAPQRIDVFDTGTLAGVMRIDDRDLTSTGDAFFHHEAMIHPATLAHPAPSRALILGGGDGGLAEELLKHPSIEHVDLVELDGDVIARARRHLKPVHQAAFDDPRLHIHSEGGADFVGRGSEGFDLIVLDLADPDTVARHRHAGTFFRQLAQRLAPGGLVSLLLGAPGHDLPRIVELTRQLRGVFDIVRPMGTHVPIYGDYWTFAVASRDRDPVAISADVLRERLKARRIGALRLYHADYHAALFTLPAYLHEALVTAEGREPPGQGACR